MEKQQIHEIMQKFGHLVEAPYGDFRGIASMAQAIMTPENTMLLAQTVMADPVGAAALGTMPRLGALDLDALAAMPEGTLGWRYGHHMLDNGFAAPPILDVKDLKGYFIAHLIEVHDIWHVVTGWGTDKAGEIGLQGFYNAQLHPSAGFLALVAKNLMKTALEDLDCADAHMRALCAGWLQGKRAKRLFGIDWKPLFAEKLESVQAGLNLSDPRSADVVIIG